MSQAFPVSPTPATTAALAVSEALVNSGAIMTLGSLPVRRHLVGQLAWVGPGRVFWFTAHGDTAEDGHVLDFDDVQVAEQSVFFYCDGKVIACLAGIAAAGVEDPDDYAIAWQLWHEVAPRRARLIRTCLAALYPNDSAHPFPSDIVRTEPNRRGGITAPLPLRTAAAAVTSGQSIRPTGVA